MHEHPSDSDLPYLQAHFVSRDLLAGAYGHDPEGVREAVAAGLLPGPAYVLEDGTELVAPDFFELAEAAGGFEALPAWFAEQCGRALARHPAAGTAQDLWEEYLTGIFAVCLRSVTPAAIVAKAELVDRVERLIDDPAPSDEGWRAELTAAVDALDAIEKPFAPFDRERFGPVSRDRLITAVRERFDLGAAVAA